MKIVSTTTEEAWTGKRINLGHLRVLGCRNFVHISGEECMKWDEKCNEYEYILMGYCDTTKGYRIFEPDKPTGIVHAIDVIFIEEKGEYYSNSVMNDSCKDEIPVHLLSNEGFEVVQRQTECSDCSETMGDQLTGEHGEKGSETSGSREKT
jgi:hypothetical protein